MRRFPKMEKACREYLKEHPEAGIIKKQEEEIRSDTFSFFSVFGEEPPKPNEEKTSFKNAPKVEAQKENIPEKNSDTDKKPSTDKKWYAAVEGGYPTISMGQMFLYTKPEPGRGVVDDIEALVISAAEKGCTHISIDFMKPGGRNVSIESFILENGLRPGHGEWKKLEVL